MLRNFIASILVLGVTASPVAAKGGGGGHGGGPPGHAGGNGRGHAASRGHAFRSAALVTHAAHGRPRAVAYQVTRYAPSRTQVVTTPAERVVVFADRDRDVVRRYYVQSYGTGDCPPGLAKKNNGCLPPGQAKKRYVIGQPLAPTVVANPLPRVLVERLGPAPAGYEYVMVDGDVLKLAVGTRLVVDAVRYLAR